MTTLSQRAEQAGPEETRGLLEKLRKLVAPSWLKRECMNFRAFLDINTPEAHLAAAMMLVPEGKVWQVAFDPRLSRGFLSDQDGFNQIHTLAETPALALIAAIAKATQPNDT